MAGEQRTEVKVPQIGESVTSAFVARWFKQVGETILEGEPLMEVDSDKASLEVPSPVSGKLLEQVAAEGDEVLVGSVIAWIDASVAALPLQPLAPAADPAADPAPAEDAGQLRCDARQGAPVRPAAYARSPRAAA